MLYPLPPFDAFQNCKYFTGAIGRRKEGDRPANHLGSRIAKEPFRASVPASDQAIEILADNGVVGKFHHVGQQASGLFDLLTLRDIPEHQHRAANFSVHSANWSAAVVNRDFG